MLHNLFKNDTDFPTKIFSEIFLQMSVEKEIKSTPSELIEEWVKEINEWYSSKVSPKKHTTNIDDIDVRAIELYLQKLTNTGDYKQLRSNFNAKFDTVSQPNSMFDKPINESYLNKSLQNLLNKP